MKKISDDLTTGNFISSKNDYFIWKSLIVIMNQLARIIYNNLSS